MRFPLGLLNFVLRWVEKPKLARAVDVMAMRRRFECQSRLVFANVPDCAVVAATLPGADGELPVLWVQHKVPSRDGVILYLHGGAYTMGSPRTHAAMLARLCQLTGLRAVLPDYRMAPEHPFPAGSDDALAAYRALLARGYDAGKIALGGDSAGGGLMLGLLHRIGAEGLEMPGAVFALSPWTDLTLSGDSMVANAARDPFLPAVRTAYIRDMYLAGADPELPHASPLFGVFKGAPPVLVQVGDSEILLDDSRRIVAAMLREGVDARLEVWPDVPHVWQMFQGRLPAADRALAGVAAFLKEVLPD